MSITKAQWQIVCDWIYAEQQMGNEVRFKPNIQANAPNHFGAMFATESNMRVCERLDTGGIVLRSSKGYEPQVLTHKNFTKMAGITDRFEVTKGFVNKEHTIMRTKKRMKQRKLP